MATPFIDSLSDAHRALVDRRSKKERRPSYYDGLLTATSEGNVKISLDFEAALILTPNAIKKDVLRFINEAVYVTSNMNADDYSLIQEVVERRGDSYLQINTDVGKKVLQYDTARANLVAFIDQVARSESSEAGDTARATEVVIPDLGALFSSLSNAYTTLSRPDDLAVHDRIADSGYLYTIQNAATHRARELSSWASIFTAYLT